MNTQTFQSKPITVQAVQWFPGMTLHGVTLVEDPDGHFWFTGFASTTTRIKPGDYVVYPEPATNIPPYLVPQARFEEIYVPVAETPAPAKVEDGKLYCHCGSIIKQVARDLVGTRMPCGHTGGWPQVTREATPPDHCGSCGSKIFAIEKRDGASYANPCGHRLFRPEE